MNEIYNIIEEEKLYDYLESLGYYFKSSRLVKLE